MFRNFFVFVLDLFLRAKCVTFVCLYGLIELQNDMKKIGLILALLLCSLSYAAYAQMSDDQVVAYVKSAMASGKSQDAITKELLARGVTMEQAERIKDKMQNQGVSGDREQAGSASDDVFSRSSGAVSRRNDARTNYEYEYPEPRSAASRARRQSRRDVGRDPNRDRSAYETQREELNNRPQTRQSLSGMMSAIALSDGVLPDSLRIFGHDIFSGEGISFEPNENLATPEVYQLGPGDQLQIEIYGYNEASYTKTISPEGTINISQIGQVQLGGLTIKEAREKLRRLLVSKYASIGGSNPNTSVSITLRNIRTIMVNVMGEVEMPGTFRLSPFATVFNALYNAGGVTENGSLRAVKVVRGGEEIATVDAYGYLFDGKSDSDITLKEGDVVIVPPYVSLVRAAGEVKRPMFYELAAGETLSDLLGYAGGFGSKAYRDDLRVIRRMGAERQVYTVKSASFGDFEMKDGDEVYVGETLDRFSNKVEIRGAVFRPGMFELGGDIATVRQLIRAAGGLKEDAFLGRAVLVREQDDLNFESLSLDLKGILAGAAEDVLLRKNDILTISANRELVDPGSLTINGYVREPGVFPFAANMTVEDLILLAGGLLDGASTARVDVSRRVVDPASTMPTDTVGETFSFALKDGLTVDGESFFLQPYDIVSVRRSPSYRPQRFVRIEGEVAFPGSYVLLTEGERASDLIKRAGGLTNQAFLRGGILTRRPSEEDLNVQNALLRISASGNLRDSLQVDRLAETFSVGIELDKALARPGSEYDPILREGDRIFVPEQISTVRISGNVLYPNTVIFVPGKPLRYYISQAGGYGFRARKSKTYIVYMNGRVRSAGSGNPRIEPGCEIVVPSKPEREGMSVAEVMTLSSSAATMATMVATLVNLFRR